MHEYHLNLILSAKLNSTQLTAEKEAVLSQLSRHEGAEIVETDEWGVRRFAYPIQKTHQGYYIIYKVKLPSTAPKAIESSLRLRDNVMRVLVVRIRPERQTLKAERRRTSYQSRSRTGDRDRGAPRSAPATRAPAASHASKPAPAETPAGTENVAAS